MTIDLMKRSSDRFACPNPITGTVIEGPILEEQYASFVGKYPMPIRYGMTPGELAKMIKGESWMKSMEQLIGIQSFRDSIDKMRRPDSILEEWELEIEEFKKTRKKYLLYK